MVFCCILQYFVAKSVFFCNLRCFVAKPVLVRFTRFCVEKNLAKNCARGEKMTNMRYGHLKDKDIKDTYMSPVKVDPPTAPPIELGGPALPH